MSSSTMSRYGSTGAACESFTFQMAASGVCDVTVQPSCEKRPARLQSSDTEKVCMQPMRSDATNAPASEPIPPTTTMTKTMGPTSAAMPGSVTKALPPMTPARPASAAPPPKTSMKTRGTLCPSASTVCGCDSAAWMTRPIRVLVSAIQIATSIDTDTSIMKPRYIGYWLPMIVKSGPSSSRGTRYSTALRPQTRCTVSSM